MRIFKGIIRTDKVQSECEFCFEVEDDANEEEIEKEAKDSAFNHVEWWYEEVEYDE